MAEEDLEQQEQSSTVDIYGGFEPRSLINIVPSELRDCILKVKAKYLAMSEKELAEEVDIDDPFIGRLRKAFWREYEASQADKRDFNVHRVSAVLNIPTRLLWPHFKNKSKMAWILCPPTEYRFALEEALDAGVKNLRQIVGLPVVTKNGRIDYKAAKLSMEAYKMVEARLFGAVITKNLHMHAHEHSQSQIDENMSDEELDREIKRLEEKEARERARKAIVEVESVRISDEARRSEDD